MNENATQSLKKVKVNAFFETATAIIKWTVAVFYLLIPP